MRPLELRITNFRSFTKTQAFRFPDQPGLYFIEGVNEAEPRLGSNGAGKSTIWDALTWLFFAKTARGMKAGDINNWEAEKGTRVELDFQVEGTGGIRNATVSRTWGPISWKLLDRDTGESFDLAKEPDNPVITGERGLRLEFGPFLASVLTAQRSPMFLDLKHDQQAALFSEVMGLDRWLDYAKRASEAASKQDAVSRGLERRHSELRGQLEGMGSHDLKERADEWQANMERRRSALGLEYEQALQHGPRKDDVDFVQTLGDDARKAIERHKADPPQTEAQIKLARADYQDLSDALRDLVKEQDAVKEQREHLKHNDTCYACGQTLKFGDLRRSIEDESKRLQKLVMMAREDLELADRARSEADAKWLAWDDELKALRGKLQDAEDAAVKARRDLQAHERDLDRMEETAADLEATPNPFADMEADERRRRGRLIDELEDVQYKLDESNGQYALCSFWVRGFKELRLQLIAEALTELEVEVNSCVNALGLVGWELRFQVDRETKTGSIQRGFSVMVRSPHNEKPVPWEAWSGGETQRLSLATNMGLADLIRSHTGATFPVEVWDEPTQGLSPQGAQDLLESLAARARLEQRQVFVIDHRNHGFGGFDGTYTVIKAPSGSRIRNV